MADSEKPERGFLRGLQNYGDRDFSIYMRRAFAKSMGYTGEELKRPVVGIAYTHSKFNPCHRHFPELLEAIKRGVAAAGGLALEFPTTSLHESTLAPNSMKFRNLMAMDTEEMIRAQPMDSVVLMGGCDKTVPAQLMGAASAGKPAIQLIGGPQMTSRYKDDRVGACTDCRKFWTQYRAGKLGEADIDAVEGRLVTTAGTCAVMGTASTMAAIAEALGMTLPGTAAIPAVHADRLRASEATGVRAVRAGPLGLDAGQDHHRAVRGERGPRAAGAGRLHQRRDPPGSDRRPPRPQARSRAAQRALRHHAGAGAVKPVGNEFYMEDFFAAGGIGAVLRELKPLLHLDCMTIAGRDARAKGSPPRRAPTSTAASSSRRPTPLEPHGGLVALFGSLAPDGAIIKRSAATPSLFETTARAVVFSSLEDMAARVDFPELDVTAGRHSHPAECRPAQSRRHAGGGLPADPQEAAGRRRQGHGAHLGRAHVRHRLRHHRAARGAGGGRRRAARASCARATRSASPSRSGGSTCWWTRRSWPSGGRPRVSDPRGLTPPCAATTSCFAKA